jgi:peroxiredoxin
MYPHERSLVKRLADKPFVILGINSDEDREALKKTIEKEQLTWRSFWDGGGHQGLIATAYNVQSWPTIFILDAKGVIQYTSVGADEKKLDEVIEALLKEQDAVEEKKDR